jgi:hypothetical protein
MGAQNIRIPINVLIDEGDEGIVSRFKSVLLKNAAQTSEN